MTQELDRCCPLFQLELWQGLIQNEMCSYRLTDVTLWMLYFWLCSIGCDIAHIFGWFFLGSCAVCLLAKCCCKQSVAMTTSIGLDFEALLTEVGRLVGESFGLLGWFLITRIWKVLRRLQDHELDLRDDKYLSWRMFVWWVLNRVHNLLATPVEIEKILFLRQLWNRVCILKGSWTGNVKGW